MMYDLDVKLITLWAAYLLFTVSFIGWKYYGKLLLELIKFHIEISYDLSQNINNTVFGSSLQIMFGIGSQRNQTQKLWFLS